MMIKKVEHVAIVVKDMDKAIDFYSSLFDFDLRVRGTNEKREMAFLSHKDQPDFEIEIIRDLVSEICYSEIGIVNHLAFTVENIEVAMKHYQSKGIEFNSDVPVIAIDGAKVVFFNGPNQELLQLVQPNK